MVSIPTRYNISEIQIEGEIANMITKFGVSRLTISFKIATVGLINQYLKMKNSSLFLYF